MPDSLQDARRRLEEAIASAEYAQAQMALLEYSRAVSAAAGGIDPQKPQTAEPVREALEVLMLASRAVRAGREHALQQLARLSARSNYGAQSAMHPTGHTLEG